MTDTPPGSAGPELPEAVPAPGSRWHVQIVWLIPLVAALIGGWLAVRAVLAEGPVITISFASADGLEPGKTKLKYKDVDIGLVKSVVLAKDLSKVIATAELVEDFKPHLVADTRFWVVRPRISGGTVSGIGTLLSGAYVGVDVGHSSKARSDFAGLEVPPVFQTDVPGREYKLHAENIGSIDTGVPVYYLQLPVGQVSGYQLDPDGKGITIRAFIKEPYARFVNANTRFWNAGGIKVKLDAGGVKLDTQSLLSILIGGVAFDNPPGERNAGPVAEDAGFKLFPDRDMAMKNPETEPVKMVMVFEESVRGLALGAPVDFDGIVVGDVTAIHFDIDPKSGKIIIPVEMNIYPQRFRLYSRSRMADRTEAERRALIDSLVAQGLRAQLRTANLLTGQLYVALDYFPNQPKASMNWAVTPPELPTIKGNLQEIQAALVSVANKLDKLPLQKIGTELATTLASAHALLARLDTDVAPAARGTLIDAQKALRSADRLLAPDQAMQQDLQGTLREVGRAAQALRVLADYLERHPESLIHGKPEDRK